MVYLGCQIFVSAQQFGGEGLPDFRVECFCFCLYCLLWILGVVYDVLQCNRVCIVVSLYASNKVAKCCAM